MLGKRGRALLAAILCVPLASLYGQDKRTPSMPDSALLFGIYNNLRFVTPDRVLEIKPLVEEGYNSAYFVYPSLAPRGDLIAWDSQSTGRRIEAYTLPASPSGSIQLKTKSGRRMVTSMI
jgi:hypothetical protein